MAVVVVLVVVAVAAAVVAAPAVLAHSFVAVVLPMQQMGSTWLILGDAPQTLGLLDLAFVQSASIH